MSIRATVTEDLPRRRERSRKARRIALLAHKRRVRDAGGPEDNATYFCQCGLVFAAAVTTGVRCPACGAGQAW